MDNTEYFVSGEYFEGPQGELLKEAFEQVDGYREPYGLLHPNYREIPAEERKKPTPLNPMDAVNRGMKGSYQTQRNFWSNDGYRPRIGIQAKSPKSFFEELRKRLGIEILSVLDFGCGQGRALSTILKQPAVDETTSIGVTLPHIRWEKPANNRTVYANTAHLGAKRRFSVLFSVLGGLYYHPFNHTRQAWTGAHGLMHAINLTSAPGIIVGYGGDLYPNGIDFNTWLEGKSIVKRCSPKEDGFVGIEVLRRPTLEEVHEFMVKNYPQG